MKEQLWSKTEELKPQIVDFCSRLIRVPSLSGEEGAVAVLIQNKMLKLGFDEVIVDPVGNVIGILKGQGGGDNIMFNCHMDHVSPGNLADWEYPPYDGKVDETWVHGRAASDTKGAIASQIYGAYLLKTLGLKTKGDIILTFVIDEEPGDMWGMKHLCQDWLDRPVSLVVLGEATSLNIYLGHRGRLEMELVSRGKMSHSSAPWLGINAVNKMIPVLAQLEEVSRSLPEDKELGRSTLVVTHISCVPGWGSTVPDICTVWIDRRYLPSESTEEVIAQVQAVVDRCRQQDPDINVEVRIRELDHKSYTGITEKEKLLKQPYLISRDDPYVQCAVKALQEIGQNPGFDIWDFGTDGSYTAHVLGIPTIGYSPCEEVYAHRSTDRVRIDYLMQAAAGNAAIALAVAGEF
ncbi:MAG: YgeY family selenium metabolism-linked hydrolase [Bacillota bacterium]